MVHLALWSRKIITLTIWDLCRQTDVLLFNILSRFVIPVLGRSPGEVHGNPLQYSSLENPMDRGAWWAAAHGSQRVGHNLANKQQRALGRGDRDHLCAKCSILVDLRSLSVTTFGYQVKNHILHLAFFLGFIEASFVSSSCLPFGLCPQ